MNEQVKSFVNKFKEFFSKLSKKTIRLITIALIVIVVGAVVIAVVLNNQPYSVLFTGLSNEESTTIVSYLVDNGYTNYRLEGTGTILVPTELEEDLKAKMLYEGYPSTGYAYETYTKMSGTMTTESERNRAYIYDLQDRMAGVIRRMENVKDAVVNITPAEDQTYILDRTNATKAQASVFVTMQGNAQLSTKLANAIRSLVSHAAQGLEFDSVVILDSLGNTYSVGGDYEESGDASLLKLYLEEQVNNTVRTQVMNILTPLYGDDNVKVGVNSTVDVRRSVGESIHFTEPDWAADGSTNGRGIIGSQIYDREIIRDYDDLTGGLVGTETNSDINTYVENGLTVDGDERYLRDSGELNYYVDTDKEQVERVAATVTDVMVSVSINSTTAGSVNVENLTTHVAKVAGISDLDEVNKISILVAPFYNPEAPINPIVDPPYGIQTWMLYAAIIGVALVLVLLILITILRRKSRKKKAKELSAMLDGRIDEFVVTSREEPAGADIMEMRTEKSMELRRNIRQFAEDNPEIAAQMVKSWLRGGEL